MSIGLTVEIEGDLAAIAALHALEHLDEDELLTAIGAEGEQQSRRRIEEEKTGPDGTPWPKNWAGNPILMRTGRNLRDSLAYNVLPGAVEWERAGNGRMSTKTAWRSRRATGRR